MEMIKDLFSSLQDEGSKISTSNYPNFLQQKVLLLGFVSLLFYPVFTVHLKLLIS